MSKRGDEKPPEVTAEGELSPQMGSDKIDLMAGRLDMRRLSKLGPIDKAWLSYFILLGPEEGGDFAKAFCNNFINFAVSDDGWRVNKMIQAIGASKGAPGVGELVKKPGLLQRNLTDRDWKKKADEEGKTIVE